MLMQTNIIQLWSNLLNPLQLTQREDSLERNVDFRSIVVKFCIRVELNFKVHNYWGDTTREFDLILEVIFQNSYYLLSFSSILSPTLHDRRRRNRISIAANLKETTLPIFYWFFFYTQWLFLNKFSHGLKEQGRV